MHTYIHIYIYIYIFSLSRITPRELEFSSAARAESTYLLGGAAFSH